MLRARAAAAVLLLLVAGGCSRPLPEEGSADATLYAARCGTCHRAYQPHAMTPAMWKVQVDRMTDVKYEAAGHPPPTADERARILAYLQRNAGG